MTQFIIRTVPTEIPNKNLVVGILFVVTQYDIDTKGPNDYVVDHIATEPLNGGPYRHFYNVLTGEQTYEGSGPNVSEVEQIKQNIADLWEALLLGGDK